MAMLVRIKNQVLDLEAIQHAGYVPKRGDESSRLQLIVGGVLLNLDQDDDADAFWAIITERLPMERIDAPIARSDPLD